MSDFGADTCDFHSDFASDFPGAPRTAKQPPETPRKIHPGHMSGSPTRRCNLWQLPLSVPAAMSRWRW